MLISLAFAAAQFDPAGAVLDLASHSHGRMTRYALQAKGELTTAEIKITPSYTIRRASPSRFAIISRSPDSREKSFYLNGGEVTLYSRDTEQYMTKGRKGQVLEEWVRAELPQIDGFVMTMAEPALMAEFLKEMGRRDDWTYTLVKGKPQLSLKGVDGRLSLTFDPDTLRLIAYQGNRPEGYASWKIAYEGLSSTGPMTPPASAYRVSRFDDSLKLPTYASDEARTLTAKLFRRYEGDKDISLEVSDGPETVRLFSEGINIRQQDAKVDWAYDGETLTLLDKRTKTAYVGNAKPSELVDLVAESGTRIDPLMRDKMRRMNPFRLMFSGAKMSVVGTLSVEGISAKMLSAKGEKGSVTVILDPSNGRAISLASQAATSRTTYLAPRTLKEIPLSESGGFQPRVPQGWKKKSLDPLR